MSSARRVEPRRTAVGDEARDQLLDAGIFDRAVARARDDDQSSVRKDTAPAAEVRRRIERVGASRQQVTEYLNEFDRGKIILREGRRIIVNPKNLRKVIESKP